MPPPENPLPPPRRKSAPAPSYRARAARSACAALALTAAAFALAVLFLIVTDYQRYRTADPLYSPEFEELRGNIRKNPESVELRGEMRRLDLLARRAYFSSVAFRRRGAYLLLGAGIVLLLALKGRRSLAPARPDPGPWPGHGGAGTSPASSRLLVAITGVLTAGTAVLLVFLFRPPPLPVAGTGGGAAPGEAAALWEERLRQWPSFRGPDGIGRAVLPGTPRDWDGREGRNVLWKVPLPRGGFSSPVVWGDRVFVTGGDDEAREIFCYHAATGDLLWSHDAAVPPGSAASLPEVTEDTGHAASTPATDGRRVFAVFSTGDLVAVDFAGKRAWDRRLGAPDNPYGHSASLLVWKDLLIVQYDHLLEARVLALDTSSGETVWENYRDLDVSWSSPVIVPGEGGDQLVLNGNPSVVAYDPRSGVELWRIECMSGELAPSPAFGAGMVFAANEYARLAAILPGETPVLVWEHQDGLPEVSSPAATDSLLFMANGYGTVTCLDTRSGRVNWQEEFDEGFYASPIVADGRVYIMDRTGVMRIFAASPDYRVLGSPVLGEPSTATGAFVGRRIYLRGDSHLFCVGESEP